MNGAKKKSSKPKAVATGAMREGAVVTKTRLVTTADAPAIAHYLKGRAMGQGFDAFGNNLPVEGLGQPDHAFDNAHILGVVQHVAHKALVDLE